MSFFHFVTVRRAAGVGTSAKVVGVQRTTAQQLEREEERFLQLVVELRLFEREVERACIRRVEMGMVEEPRSSSMRQMVLATISSFFSSVEVDPSGSLTRGVLVRLASWSEVVAPRQRAMSMVEEFWRRELFFDEAVGDVPLIDAVDELQGCAESCGMGLSAEGAK